MKTAVIEAKVSVSQELREAVIALLAEIGFHAFEETEAGVDAYINAPGFDLSLFEQTLAALGKQTAHYHLNNLEPKNWNEVWEQNYQSIAIDNFCQIIPSFRKPESHFTHTIVIDPKMSFGTGHHQTTRLMMRHLQRLDIHGKTVLDMGCGTGILAILAAKMGASKVIGIDIDPWSIENARENSTRNKVLDVAITQGDVHQIPATIFDVILANINRNVLLEDIAEYAQKLSKKGQLILSGFYENDVASIRDCAQNAGLELAHQLNEDNWVALHLVNSEKNC